ncbi:hypothetical protein HJG60_011772 [Phyllostomus discolor]|uniref:Uncharacterized protein n=1 Tax=Phyllostomus discolor TaxID=89673 RepID=A0A833ZCV0_9CHIR|nr:hypothetical protein HJG60_011772 [Phyllostomus discolor]
MARAARLPLPALGHVSPGPLISPQKCLELPRQGPWLCRPPSLRLCLSVCHSVTLSYCPTHAFLNTGVLVAPRHLPAGLVTPGELKEGWTDEYWEARVGAMETTWKAQKLRPQERLLRPIGQRSGPPPGHDGQLLPIFLPSCVCLIPSLPGCTRAQRGWPPAGQWDNGASHSCKLHGALSLFSWPSLLPPPPRRWGGGTDFNLQLLGADLGVTINRDGARSLADAAETAVICGCPVALRPPADLGWPPGGRGLGGVSESSLRQTGGCLLGAVRFKAPWAALTSPRLPARHCVVWTEAAVSPGTDGSQPPPPFEL